jgi:lipopolysaccharide/colanic/teichoic acid biosynthesis glycosyltransferase
MYRRSLLRGWGYSRIKRVLDILFACALLLLFGPLMLLIALAIKLQSSGPIIFRQQRIGKDGTPFPMLKFRTMYHGSDSQTHQSYVQRLIRENIAPQALGTTSLKLKDDPRITRLGKVLRASSLDELPQLVNVLRGTMSLVGPRPAMPYEYEVYNDWHKQRLQVLPGITGLWQVTAHNQVSFEEMVHIDLAYIQTMNPWLDLKIMLLTPLEMLRGKGGG